MDAARAAQTADQDQQIARFLRANPEWLAAHPELYRVLAPPKRVHGEKLADHMAAMILRERQHAEAMTAEAESVLAAGRASASLLARVHDAVPALIMAADRREYLATELPSLLSIDAVCVCLHGGSGELDAEAPRLTQLLGTRDLLFRDEPQDAQILYREAASLARHDALVRLPALGVMGLAARAGSLNAITSQTGLHFLGRVVAALLRGVVALGADPATPAA